MNETPPSTALIPASPQGEAHPGIIRRARAEFAAEEFLAARIQNPHTRRAYGRLVGRFLAWCEARGTELRDITPGMAAGFIESLAPSTSTQRLALAALRQFFDVLVTRHAILLNPFLSVRGPPRPSSDGKTAEITPRMFRELIAAVDCSMPAGLRDRAVLGTLAFTGARVGAVAGLRLQDLRDCGDFQTLRFQEKRGKEREIPVRLELDKWVRAYIAVAVGDGEPKNAPLFRSMKPGSRTAFNSGGIGPWTIRALLKRRLRDAGLPEIITPHSFRVMVVTDLLSQDVPMEEVQFLVGHSDPSTTQIYDRRGRKVTRNLVERIGV